MMTCKRLARLLSPLAFVLLVAQGCHQEVELGQVHGRILMDGEPLPDATVRFVPVGGGRSALGRTDANGHYEMQYSATASGALVGPVRVEITVAEEAEDERGRTYMKPETVPAKYNVNSVLIADVQPGTNSYDFELSSK
jgi:hypothetical protein